MRNDFGKTKTREELHTEQHPDQRRWLRNHPDGGRWVSASDWHDTTPFTWQGHWLSILDWNGYEDRDWIEVMDPLTKCEEAVTVTTDPDRVKEAVEEVQRRLTQIHYNDLVAANVQLHAWDAWLTRNETRLYDTDRRLMAEGIIALYNKHKDGLPGEERYRIAELANALVHEKE